MAEIIDEVAQLIRIANNRVGARQLAEDILAKAEPYYLEKGRQMERAVWHKKLRRLGVSLQLNPALYKRLIATLLGEAKGGKDAHIIT